MFLSLAHGYRLVMRCPRHRIAALGIAIAFSAAACSSSDSASDGGAAPTSPGTSPESSPETGNESGDDTEATADQQYPDVIDAAAMQEGDTWTFDVTISSPYDTPERYADGWRVLSPGGTELGFRLLTHDHASEQPFTRSLDGVEIPDDVDMVTIEGRDQVNGFGGETFELTLDR